MTSLDLLPTPTIHVMPIPEPEPINWTKISNYRRALATAGLLDSCLQHIGDDDDAWHSVTAEADLKRAEAERIKATMTAPELVYV